MRSWRNTSSAAAESVELTLRSADAPRDVQLLCRPRISDGTGHQQYLTAMIDVTVRKQLESAREQSAMERADLARRLISIQEDERKRIARDLHDNLGQQVTALRLRLELLAGRENTGDETRGALIELQQALQQLDYTIDTISAELRPVALDLGFRTAVEQFVRTWSSTFGIAVDIRTDTLQGVTLDPDVETHVFRAIQEALNNVYKHAGATEVVVLLEWVHQQLSVTIRDNGQGFSPDAPGTTRRGLGLLSMRERTEIINGLFHISSVPRRGTTVSLVVPNAFAS
jgi:signal transduction histidine kinase